MKKFLALLLICFFKVTPSVADGLISSITSAPIYPNGIVTDLRSGLNIHLQSSAAQGIDFMDPAVPGYGFEAGGSLEVELISGFQRDPDIPLDDRTILLVAGTPQQGLPAEPLGLEVLEGDNPYTYVIRPKENFGIAANALLSVAPGAALDPIRQKGIKIIHIGRLKAFVSRGKTGVIEVRFKDSNGDVIKQGRGSVRFLNEPRPEIFPTNIPHDQRNHNWQRVGSSQIVGVAPNTIPISLILYSKNEGLERKGLLGAGVVSRMQLEAMNFRPTSLFHRFNGGLIIRDSNNNGRLEPGEDQIVGGIREIVPDQAQGNQVVTPVVNDKPFLSNPTAAYNERAAQTIGGAIMQVVYVAGNKPGRYRIEFILLERPGDLNSKDGSSFTYTVVVE